MSARPSLIRRPKGAAIINGAAGENFGVSLCSNSKSLRENASDEGDNDQVRGISLIDGHRPVAWTQVVN